ncbi:hypothetical protein [Terribacillus sp. 179-K 1B1 HS]|uniref:hypothetical protein n=1 Tax=Terribacillus sp. 179-K 1B1 HS TaxID=3142388 RepID=UPI0039A022D5
MMKKLLFFLLSCILLTACNSHENANEEGAAQKEETNNETTANQSSQDVQKDGQQRSPNQNTSKNSRSNTSKDLSEIIIPTITIPSPFGEDGNIRYTHDSMEAFRNEYGDENDMIHFNLEEGPIRSVSTGDNMKNIVNYGDAYINILEAQAFALENEADIHAAYDLFISNPPEQLKDLTSADYRSWEEATNVEKGIMQMVFLIAPAVGDTKYIVENDLYDEEALAALQEQFERIGSPNVLIPAPQTALDLQLYDNAMMVQTLWGELGQFEDPQTNKEEFAALYKQVNQETNNLLVRVNYTLSEPME